MSDGNVLWRGTVGDLHEQSYEWCGELDLDHATPVLVVRDPDPSRALAANPWPDPTMRTWSRWPCPGRLRVRLHRRFHRGPELHCVPIRGPHMVAGRHSRLLRPSTRRKVNNGMAGRVLREGTPNASHHCSPPDRFRLQDGAPEPAIPRLVTVHHAGTVWECGCGQTWVAEDTRPESWRRERRLERWRRRRRGPDRGGYPSSTRPARELASPPPGSAPGAAAAPNQTGPATELVARLTAAMRDQLPTGTPIPDVIVRPGGELTPEDRQRLSDRPNGLLVIPEEMVNPDD